MEIFIRKDRKIRDVTDNLSSIHQVSHWKHVSSTMWTFPYDPEESANQENMAYISQLSQEVSEWSISLIFPFIYIS